MLISGRNVLVGALESRFAFPEPTACSRLRQQQYLWHSKTCTGCSNLLFGNLGANPILSQL